MAMHTNAGTPKKMAIRVSNLGKIRLITGLTAWLLYLWFY
jgi:hypothetical protein